MIVIKMQIALTTKVHTDVHAKMDSPVTVKHASTQTNVLRELTLVASSQIVLIEMVILTVNVLMDMLVMVPIVQI